MNKLFNRILLLIFLPSLLFAQQKTVFQNNGDVSRNISKNKVILSAHRCSWRTAPENSVQALKDCIEMGVDIAEFDLKRTKDGHLIVMHDRTIDRTTTGKGKPEDYTLEEIRKLRLRSATGHQTRHQIPTFEEMLVVAKGKITLDIDKGYPYFKEALELIKKHGMMRQIIYNVTDGMPYDSVVAKHGTIDPELFLMVVVDPSSEATDRIISSYAAHKNTIVQTVYASDTVRILSKISQIRKTNSVWFNALWPEHSANHDDDIAVEEKRPDDTWGWLIGKGANIIQTDRPKELLSYLKRKKLHQ